MGQAKNRGTYEQRRESAIERNSGPLQRIKRTLTKTEAIKAFDSAMAKGSKTLAGYSNAVKLRVIAEARKRLEQDFEQKRPELEKGAAQ